MMVRSGRFDEGGEQEREVVSFAAFQNAGISELNGWKGQICFRTPHAVESVPRCSIKEKEKKITFRAYRVMTQWNKFHKWSHSKCAFSLFYYVFYCHYYFLWHARFVEQGAAEPVYIGCVFWAREMMPRLISNPGLLCCFVPACESETFRVQIISTTFRRHKIHFEFSFSIITNWKQGNVCKKKQKKHWRLIFETLDLNIATLF